MAALHPPELPQGKLHLTWQYPPRMMRDGSLAKISELQSNPDYGYLWLKGPSAAWKSWTNRLLDSVADIYPVGLLNMFPQNRNRRWEEVEVDGQEE